jgi:hypothetical protein
MHIHCHGWAGEFWWHPAWRPPTSAVGIAEPIASGAAVEVIVVEFVAIDPMLGPTTFHSHAELAGSSGACGALM